MSPDDDLFADLAAAAEALEQRELDAEVVERARGAWGAARWADQCRDAAVTLRVAGLGNVEGLVGTVTAQWLLLHAGPTVDWVVAIDAVLGVTGGRGGPAEPAADGVVARTGWFGAWTVLARDRATVQVVRRDGSRVDGVPAVVGADFVDLRTDGGRRELVPHAAVGAVRTARPPRSRAG